MGSDLALVYQRPVGDMQILDRIFDRDDVDRTGLIDVIDQCSETGAFSRSGRPGDENQPVGQIAPLDWRLWQSQLGERAKFVLKTTQSDRVAWETAVDIETETPLAIVAHREGTVERTGRGDGFLGRAFREFFGEEFHFLFLEDVRVSVQLAQFPADAEERTVAWREVQIGRLGL
ncbi:MAG: hypothetical protein AAF267_05790 [Deinococcota bacterium]